MKSDNQLLCVRIDQYLSERAISIVKQARGSKPIAGLQQHGFA